MALSPRVSKKQSSYGLAFETFPWLILQLVIQITALRLVDVFMFNKEATKMAKQVESSHNTFFLSVQYLHKKIVFVRAKLDSTLRT